MFKKGIYTNSINPDETSHKGSAQFANINTLLVDYKKIILGQALVYFALIDDRSSKGWVLGSL